MLDNIYKMVAESLVSKADTGARGETQSPNRHTLDRAYRNGHRWQEHPSINVSSVIAVSISGCCRCKNISWLIYTF